MLGRARHAALMPPQAVDSAARFTPRPENVPVRPGDGALDRMNFTTYPRLHGRTVIVTGGASGIGEAFVRGAYSCANRGPRVRFRTCSRIRPSPLQPIPGSEGEKDRCSYPCDITELAGVRAALRPSMLPPSGLLRC